MSRFEERYAYHKLIPVDHPVHVLCLNRVLELPRMLLDPLHVLLLGGFDLSCRRARWRCQSFQCLRLCVLVRRNLLSPRSLLEDVRVNLGAARTTGRIVRRSEVGHGVLVSVTDGLEALICDLCRLVRDNTGHGGFNGNEKVKGGKIAPSNGLS